MESRVDEYHKMLLLGFIKLTSLCIIVCPSTANNTVSPLLDIVAHKCNTNTISLVLDELISIYFEGIDLLKRITPSSLTD